MKVINQLGFSCVERRTLGWGMRRYLNASIDASGFFRLYILRTGGAFFPCVLLGGVLDYATAWMGRGYNK